MRENNTWFDRVVTALLPLAFIGSSFLNVLAFVLDGHHHEWFRTMFVIGIQGVAALFFLAKTLYILRKSPTFRKWSLFTLLIPLFFGAVYLWALIAVADKAAILRSAFINGCYLVSACCAVLIIVLERKLPAFLGVCRVYAVILSPAILYY